MDLREKPGKVQKFLELMLRFRLIALLVMVVVTVTVCAKSWNELVGLPIWASEKLGMWYANLEGVQGAWNSVQFLAVAFIASVVMFFVFGGVRSGIASLFSVVLSVGTLFALDGDESMALPFFGALALISLLLLLFAKWSVACVLFPFTLNWLFLSALLDVIPCSIDDPVELVWGSLSTLGFAGSMAFAVAAGKHLGTGAPQNGAIVKAAQQTFVPVVVGALMLVSAIAVDIPGGASVLYTALWYVAFIAWFFVFLVPVSSFAPWERLRSGSRRVEMKDKKKKSSKK